MDGTTGDMPAHSAAYMCVPSALQALIDAGAGDTMDLPNNKGDTPIFLAAKGIWCPRPYSSATSFSRFLFEICAVSLPDTPAHCLVLVLC